MMIITNLLKHLKLYDQCIPLKCIIYKKKETLSPCIVFRIGLLISINKKNKLYYILKIGLMETYKNLNHKKQAKLKFCCCNLLLFVCLFVLLMEFEKFKPI